MGILKGYDKIAKAAGFKAVVTPESVVEGFQAMLFQLLFDSYNLIKTPDPISDVPDETLVTLSLFDALNIIASRDSIPCTVSSEVPEFTNDMRSGKKKTISAKKYDVYFENWNKKERVEFGVEAKLLIENNFKTRVATAVISDYVSDKGMGKYINGIYQKRGFMIGYIVEGDLKNIVTNVNKQVEKNFDLAQILSLDSSFKHNYIYKSQHKSKLPYNLYHLLFTFT